MREIEFRGKKNHGKWRRGCIVKFEGLQAAMYYPIYHRVQGDEFKVVRTDWCYVDESTVGQYIGRKDCDGKPIFEGDIFTVNGKYPKLVKYIDEWHSFCVANLDTITDPCMSRWDDVCKYQQPAPNWWNDFKREIKVIGNMYDNPELIKVKEL
jgi:uncharacterized phage protein (TIGR01671 family)